MNTYGFVVRCVLRSGVLYNIDRFALIHLFFDPNAIPLFHSSDRSRTDLTKKDDARKILHIFYTGTIHPSLCTAWWTKVDRAQHDTHRNMYVCWRPILKRYTAHSTVHYNLSLVLLFFDVCTPRRLCGYVDTPDTSLFMIHPRYFTSINIATRTPSLVLIYHYYCTWITIF